MSRLARPPRRGTKEPGDTPRPLQGAIPDQSTDLSPTFKARTTDLLIRTLLHAVFLAVFLDWSLGLLLLVLPILLWAGTTMATGPAAILSILLIVIDLLDSVIKPIPMARGLPTPALVILLGVIGATRTYGLIGLFLGPIVPAVCYDIRTVLAGFKSASPTPAPDDIASS